MAWYYGYYGYPYKEDHYPALSFNHPPTSEASECQIQSQTAPSLNSDTAQRYSYTLKVINPKKKSVFELVRFSNSAQFKTLLELCLHIVRDFENLVPGTTSFDIGYYKGRGSKKVTINSESCLKSMYEAFKDNSEIRLWCDGCVKGDEPVSASCSGRKRKSESDDPTKSTSKRQQVRDEVHEIFATLQEKHSSKYSAHQLRLWANMLQVGTHKDYEEPPNVPMFGTSKKTASKTNPADVLSSVAEGFMRAIKTPTSSTQSPPKSSTSRSPLNEMRVSPGKCASLCTEYIQQLKQLHQLLKLTAITKDEYDQQKENILKKMKEL